MSDTHKPVGIGVLDGPKTIKFVLVKDRSADLCVYFLIFKTRFCLTDRRGRRSLQVKAHTNFFATAKQPFVPILGNRTKMVAGVPVEQRKAVPMHFAKLWNEAETYLLPLTQTFV